MVRDVFLISPEGHDPRRPQNCDATHPRPRPRSFAPRPPRRPATTAFSAFRPSTNAALTRTSLVAGAQLTDRFVKSLFDNLRYGQVKTLRHDMLGNAILENDIDHLKSVFHDLRQGASRQTASRCARKSAPGKWHRPPQEPLPRLAVGSSRNSASRYARKCGRS